MATSPLPDEQRQILLDSFPEGVPRPENFRLGHAPVPSPGDGQVLLKTRFLSLDPYLRGVISGSPMYPDRVELGGLLPGGTVAEVVETAHPDWQVGDLAVSRNGWQEFAVAEAAELRRVSADLDPPSAALGALGMPGLTAWAGLTQLGRPKSGETVVVSAAAGPVGSTVGQIARILGCRVVGIAGSDEKCHLVTNHFGFNACINYKTEDLADALASACPDGIDVYFDNVAGDTLAAVLTQLAVGARVVLCGMITQYNASRPPPGPNLAPIVKARASMHGLVVYDYLDREGEYLAEATRWHREGLLKIAEDITQGIENAPDAFCRLMRGENTGKALVKFD